MTFGLYLIFVVQIIIAYAILFIAQLPLRRKAGWVLRAVFFVVKFLLMTGVAYTVLVWDTWVTWHLGYMLGAIYLALFGDLISDLVSLPVVIIKKREGCIGIQAIITLATTVLVMIVGMVNMQNIKANELTYTSEKLTEKHRFVFLVDLHVGSSQSEDTIEKALVEIATLRPDFIVLGGDITDEFTTLEEMESTYNLLASLNTPVYFVYGNHDRQKKADRAGGAKYTPEQLENTLRDCGITVLKDEWVSVSKDLVILGREDSSVESRLSVDKLEPRPENAFVICIDHSPYEKQDIIDTGADLQLSGHTHAGQFFPLRLLYTIFGFDAYGEYHYGNTDLYVSPGISGWNLPLRTEASSQYEIVNLVPEGQR